eukprot:scaffold1319_cov126-Cylindrotheca_fusiformis.AAC.50
MATLTKSEENSTISITGSEERISTPKQVTPSAAATDNADEMLFGSMNTKIADALAERIQGAAVEGVASLPLLSDKEKAQSLVESISRTYLDRVDIMEAYAKNNIFTLCLYKPRRRQRILQACLHDLPLQQEKKETNKEMGQQPEEFSVAYPCKDDIPSPQETAALQDTLCELKNRLDAARLRHKTMLAKKKSIESAIDVSTAAVQSLNDVSTDVQEPVAKIVHSGKSIKEATNEGKELIEQLDDCKRDRDTDDDENDGVLLTTTVNKKKKRMSLEEEYRQDRQVLQTMNVDSLHTLRAMLKKKKI